MNLPTAADGLSAPTAPRGDHEQAAVTPAGARHAVAELLRRAGIGLDGVTAADALLITSELVTNAIRHGGGVTGFRTGTADGALHLSVSDANPHTPVARTAEPEHPGGFGWPLIQRLAERVEITPLADGKTITIVVRLT
ncbi:ATP-binding protein [Streptomyces sp. Isolate_45]|uniref:ATP-binding protein n=1 Tax=Streptomyces sp. Isolate_45 TaxID=2950111 RepID=UPI002481D41C|nr:ATP-binding protein [Streptomyces sp. Isolate_45]MDA5286515.1 ATP-binding protein [Streptomyces sp. Isolate_45]